MKKYLKLFSSITLTLILSVVFFHYFLQTAEAVTSGPNSCGNAQSTGPGVAWTATSSACSSDDNRATVALLVNQSSKTLRATGFLFSIPSTSTINGILVEVEKSALNAVSADVYDSIIRLTLGGATAGSNKADTGTSWPDTDAYISYGGATDLWGTTWTPTQISSSTFGVDVVAKIPVDEIDVNTARVDHIRITIYYSFAGVARQSEYWFD